MTMRFLGRAAFPAAAVLATIAIAVPASASPAGLPQLDITGVYVTGVSSGWVSCADSRGRAETAISGGPAAYAAVRACWLCAREQAGTAGCRPRAGLEPSRGLSSR